MLFLLAMFNACTIINRFTRIAGELFGMLITVLFIQEAIKVKSNQENKPTVRPWPSNFYSNVQDLADDSIEGSGE